MQNNKMKFYLVYKGEKIYFPCTLNGFVSALRFAQKHKLLDQQIGVEEIEDH